MKIATYEGRVDGEESSSLTVGDALLPLGQPRTVTEEQARGIEAVSEGFRVSVEAKGRGGQPAARADGSDNDHDEALGADDPED